MERYGLPCCALTQLTLGNSESGSERGQAKIDEMLLRIRDRARYNNEVNNILVFQLSNEPELGKFLVSRGFQALKTFDRRSCYDRKVKLTMWFVATENIKFPARSLAPPQEAPPPPQPPRIYQAPQEYLNQPPRPFYRDVFGPHELW